MGSLAGVIKIKFNISGTRAHFYISSPDGNKLVSLQPVLHNTGKTNIAFICKQTALRLTILNFELASHGPWIWFDLTANAFLQHMVRNIAGVLIEIGSGKRDINWMLEVISAKDRTKGGITAPANGLYLVGVEYPENFSISSSHQPVAFWGE